MQSRSAGWSWARASALRVASHARPTPVSPSETQWRVLIPERWVIHSSEVSISCARSTLETTRAGTWNAVAMNSVRGMGLSLREIGAGGRFRPRAAKCKGDHGSHGQPRAVRRCARGAAPARRPAEGPGRRRPRPRQVRPPPHLRRSDGVERAVRLERAHRCERRGHTRLAGVRRAGPGDPDPPGLLKKSTEGRKDGMTKTTRLLIVLALGTLPPSLFPLSRLAAQQRAMTIDDYLALKSVGDPQLSPDGRWVAYTVTEYSLKDNRGTTRVWLADVATGQTREVSAGPGSDRQPRWSPDGKSLAFVTTRQNGAQLWLLLIGGGEARRVTDLPDGVSDPVWLPDGKGLLVTSDLKWPPQQEIDRRNGDYPTEARLWTELLWRHWDDWRAGKRQHVFHVTLADNRAKDITPLDHDVPTIATSGDGDVAVAPDGREIAVALHGDSTVADNTNVDIYLMGPDGSGMRPLTTNRGADNTPRYSPDGRWLAYLSMERAGFEADRQRVMLLRRKDGRTESGAPTEVTAGWTLSVGSYTWCPDSKCVYAVVEERGRENIHRIDLPS